MCQRKPAQMFMTFMMLMPFLILINKLELSSSLLRNKSSQFLNGLACWFAALVHLLFGSYPRKGPNRCFIVQVDNPVGVQQT